jgi:hypothetical protein
MNTIYAIDRKRWATLDIFHQMGNIYSEVGRSFKSMNNIKSEEHQAAVARAIDLFDATVEVLVQKKSPKVREVLRAKEVYLDLVNNRHASPRAIRDLDRYFMQFAHAARLTR